MAGEWLEELYGDMSQWELKREYYEVTLADLTDDVGCSPSTIVTRAKTMTYLAEKIGNGVADEIDKLVLSTAEIVGFASGQKWEVLGTPHDILAEHITEHILSISHEHMGLDESRLLITLDCAIIRINRTYEGVIVDIHHPGTDELIHTFAATSEEMWEDG